jgi:hypothetical protein
VDQQQDSSTEGEGAQLGALASRDIYDKLLRGEATSAEYVAAIRRECDDRREREGTPPRWRAAGELATERDRWIRAFNRLEAAISHHKRDEGFPDVHDEALYHARDRILSDLAEPA